MGRVRAAALLDVLGVGTREDQTARLRSRVSVFVSCFRESDLSPTGLVDLVAEATSVGPEFRGIRRAAAQLNRVSRFPALALAWAWADSPTRGAAASPGQLDRSLSGSGDSDSRKHPWKRKSPTAFGVITGWRTPPNRPVGTVVISGATGTGKGVAAVYAAIWGGGRFVRAAAVGELAIGDGGGRALDELADEPFLVIDELGRENTIGKTTSRMVELITRRDDAGMATLVATNLTRRHRDPALSFERRYGDHVLDRIEKGPGGWFDVARPSIRTGASPRFDQIRSHARVAELLPRVEAAASAAPPPSADRDVADLASLFRVSSGALDEAVAKRARLHADVLEQARDLDENIMAVFERLVGGGE